MKISYLLTGNELMSGDTVDSNSSMLSQSLKDIGVVPRKKLVVGDDFDLLVDSIRTLANESDVLIVNGGLGPTRDDLTAQALAKATNTKIERHPQALSWLEEWAGNRGFVVTESNLKQADLPSGCNIIENPVGSAVGFSCVFEKCLILCTPGVPSELKLMMSEQLLPLIRKQGDLTETSDISRMRLFGITESGLQDIIDAKFPEWPSEVELGFRVQMPVIELKLRTIGEAHRSLNNQWCENLRSLFSDYIIGDDDTRLSQSLNQALLKNQRKLVTAESCTGGAIAAAITSEAGASQVFAGGFIVYSNLMKQDILGVSAATLEQHGAVSEATVIEMVQGALGKSDANIAMAISGIAGPDGGSAGKPVGTVWIAWGDHKQQTARRFFLPMKRLAFQRTATAIAMDLVRREVSGLPTNVDYFAELKRKYAD